MDDVYDLLEEGKRTQKASYTQAMHFQIFLVTLAVSTFQITLQQYPDGAWMSRRIENSSVRGTNQPFFKL